MKSILFSLLACLLISFVHSQGALQLKNVLVRVLDSEDKSIVFTSSPSYPVQIDQLIQLTEGQEISIEFQSNSSNIIQPFLILTSTSSRRASTLVFNGKAQKYSISLKIGSQILNDALMGNPGTYAMSVYLAGPGASPLSYQLGSIKFNFSEYQQGKPASHGSEFNILPEIKHVFKPDEAPPSTFLSLTFTTLVLLPWLQLANSWSKIRVNVKRMNESTPFFIYSGLFISTLIGWFALFYCYWTIFNLFEMLWLGSILSIVTLFVGRLTLVSRAKLD